MSDILNLIFSFVTKDINEIYKNYKTFDLYKLRISHVKIWRINCELIGLEIMLPELVETLDFNINQYKGLISNYNADICMRNGCKTYLPISPNLDGILLKNWHEEFSLRPTWLNCPSLSPLLKQAKKIVLLQKFLHKYLYKRTTTTMQNHTI